MRNIPRGERRRWPNIRADLILAPQAGRLVAYGTHDELMAQQPIVVIEASRAHQVRPLSSEDS